MRNTILAMIAVLTTVAANGFADERYERVIRPLLRDYCITCHSTEKQEGELDLQRFTSIEQVKKQPEVWEHVLEQLSLGEMPPKDAKQPSVEQKRQLASWVRSTLDEIALASAGDPGPVVLRRLSNHEYTYTLQDLTGVPSLDPAREFPVDGAAGEGFTNVGAALVMSPALLSKYLEAAKDVSGRMVLLEDGVRFSASDSPLDWTDEALTYLRQFYARYTVTNDLGIEVGGTGRVKSEAGAIPLGRYLDALQGRGSHDGLSPRYLTVLEQSLASTEPSPLLDPLRQKFRERQLTAQDVEAWQKVVWRFNTVGHIGRPRGPKFWQEPNNPFVNQQDFRVPLQAGMPAKLFLVAGTTGVDEQNSQVVWENPRLVVKGRSDMPIADVPELLKHLQAERARLLADTEACLAALATGNENEKENVSPKSLAAWQEYLGFGVSKLEPLLTTRLERTPDYAFIQGWRGERDLSVLANASNAEVRIPGKMKAHSVATHPAPDRQAVIAWKSPVDTQTLSISGRVDEAHPECGNGITWALEVRRGNATERLAEGVLDRTQGTAIGPIENVRLSVDHAIALVIGPRDNDHTCDMTAIELTLSDGKQTWDLAKDVSPNILAGNPHGQWHFLSQPVSGNDATDLPAPIMEWRKSPSPELAAKVRKYLEENFPLTHPLLASAWDSFRTATPNSSLTEPAPSILEVEIPAELTFGAEFHCRGSLREPIPDQPTPDRGAIRDYRAHSGSVQLQVLKERPSNVPTTLQPDLPIVVSDRDSARRPLIAAFDEFRAIFPAALCYSRIVPIDEVVTLNLYFREDEPLRRLMLSDAESEELERLWRDLLFISEAPLKQVDAFEQIYQFATQDRPDLVVEFEPMRDPILKAADQFRVRQTQADAAQRQAVIQLAERAWRRPLTAAEIAGLRQFEPRLMLVRILTSPAFLYRSETPATRTGPVNDWELASRLSYFLWSSQPDDELRSVAASGKLRNPEVLVAQTHRMLKDDRVRRLATEFGCQYLHVRDVGSLDEKSERHFPTFNSVRGDMQEEVTRFFIDLFQNDRSLLTLLDADYTFLNKPLADHYGIPFERDGWQRVEGIKKYGRGGALGFSATLAKHSGASRTSAILRGMWVSEVLLGDKIPNPPKGVPTLPEEAPDGLSERQLIELHSSNAGCAGCHKRIDPYGFALEGFDAIGRNRAAETKSVTFDGTAVDGLMGLRDYLANQRREDFLRQFGRKLLGYALGRSIQLSDQPLIDALIKTEGMHVGQMIEQIILSPQFREIRGNSP